VPLSLLVLAASPDLRHFQLNSGRRTPPLCTCVAERWRWDWVGDRGGGERTGRERVG
jgi:hypothetical protein